MKRIWKFKEKGFVVMGTLGVMPVKYILFYSSEVASLALKIWYKMINKDKAGNPKKFHKLIQFIHIIENNTDQFII